MTLAETRRKLADLKQKIAGSEPAIVDTDTLTTDQLRAAYRDAVLTGTAADQRRLLLALEQRAKEDTVNLSRCF